MDPKVRERKITTTTLVGSVVNVLLTVAKFVAGIVGHSAALVADGIHSLSDFISDVIVLVCVRISSRGRDADHSYGHGKYETFATLCVSVLLLLVGLKLCYSGVGDVQSFFSGGELHAPEPIALWIALASILSKEALYHYTAYVGRQVSSTVVMANAWHHRTDALSSIASAIGIGGAIIMGDDWAILDPLACCLISIFIIYVAFKMAMPSLKELLETSLPKETEDDILHIISSVPGVDDVHNLKTRQNGPSVIVEAHIVVRPDMTVVEAHDIATQAEQLITTQYGKETQINIHIEPSKDAE